MRKKTVWIGLVLLSLMAWTGNALAAGPANKRTERQLRRIEQGIETGELTRDELKQLKKEQKHIAKVKERARWDHHITRHEARRITKMQDRASRRIYRYKHNQAKQRRARYHAYHDHGKHHGHYKPVRKCRVDSYRGASFSGALFQPGLSLAWNIPLD